METVRKDIITERDYWWQHRQFTLASDLVYYSSLGRWRQVWSRVRQLSGSLLGPRGRVYHHTSSYYPSVSEWSNYLQQAGCQGGNFASEIWKGQFQDFDSILRQGQLLLAPVNQRSLEYHDLDFSEPSIDTAVQQGLEDFVNVTSELQRHTNGFATPNWSIPGPWNFDCDLETPSHLRHMVQALCILIRKTGILPIKWHISQGTPIPKFNQKPKAAGFRLIHLIDGFAKAWGSAIWRKKPFKLGKTAFGFVPDKCREEASLITKIILFRVAASGHSIMAILFDMKNAFPSNSWDCLERFAYSDFSQSDQYFLMLRHREMLVFLDDFSRAPC